MATKLCVVALCLIACSDTTKPVEARTAEFPAWLRAGPMLGHVSPSAARVWFQVSSDAEVRVTLKAEGLSDERVCANEDVERLGDGCRIASFRSLPDDVAGTPFEVVLKPVQGESVRMAGRFARAASSKGSVRIAFGSCCRDSEYGRAPIFARIPEHKPDAMLFLGDNSYFVRGGTGPTRFSTTTKDGDWDSHEKMLARHLATRRLPSLQKLLRTTPCYATWDDHDYGPNDADAAFVKKDEALRAFRQVWANSATPTEVGNGVAHTFRNGPVQVWMLDNRWFKRTRDKRKKLRPDATIWGKTQLEWIEKSLLASTAPVKVLANGTQIFERGFVGEGHWQEAKKERARFERFLRENKIDGVVVLSGDRHHHELMRTDAVDGARIYEFTSSPFQYGQKIAPIPKERSNETRVWGTRGNGFGLVTIDVRGPRDGTIRFEVFGESGKTPSDGASACRTEVQLSELCYER